MAENSTEVAVSIVVPVRNEADNIAPLIAEIAAALDGRWGYEIIYVNDGSTDATAERLAAARAQRANVREIRHPQSGGQSAAVRSGVRAARGAIVATLDGDGQNNPAFLPELIAAIEQGGPRVFLRAYKGLDYGRVMQVMGEIDHAGLKRVASTRNVLLPVGTDYSPPNKWVTDIQRHWRKRYVWPRFVCALPREFFAAVRAVNMRLPREKRIRV